MTLSNSGAVIGEIVYSAFGETRATYGTTQTKKLYTGQYEAEAGLYFYNARWFDNELGMFVQAESIIPDSFDPQSWNRYTYINNNPINFTDPSGHCIDDQDGLCMRRVSDNSYRVVRGGSVFPNYVEGAIANSILSQDTRYLNFMPNSSSGTSFGQ